jgi:DNA-binding response OmpR family regulator
MLIPFCDRHEARIAVMRRGLSFEGYKVLVALTARVAWLAREQPPDIVILD